MARRYLRLALAILRDRKLLLAACGAPAAAAATTDSIPEFFKTAGQRAKSRLNGLLGDQAARLGDQAHQARDLARLAPAGGIASASAGASPSPSPFSAHSLNDMLPSPLKREPALGAHSLDARQLNAAFVALSRDPIWALAVMFSASGDGLHSKLAAGADGSGDSRAVLQLAELLEQDSEAGSSGCCSGSGGGGSAGISRTSSAEDVLGLYAYAALAAQQAEH